MRKILPLVLMPGVALFAAGCESGPDLCTHYLWCEKPVVYFQPARCDTVKVFQKSGDQDILVQYTEERQKTGEKHERA